MDRRLYQELYELEEVHWWFRGRRRIIRAFLKLALARKVRQALDIGAGTGGNLPMLAEFAEIVEASEDSDEAIALARRRAPAIQIEKKFFPGGSYEGQYNLVTLFDVLEHISDDGAALLKLESMLAPEGIALLTVPALPFLWTVHDELAHHQRRYTKKSLKKLIAGNTKLKIVRLSYFNSFLFLPIVLVRTVRKLLRFGEGSSDFFMLPAPLNNLLATLFSSEAGILKTFDLPIGVSLVCLLQKVDA
ncbi:MAG: hypothetical protein A3H71_01795 [Candidatus Sungbacteria bacterium RIFCSPLOWO2_02_FULL_48_13b]|uniref:Class I SAM-dependent methyltransferase n=2 Tax=Candidatus Sungiibacteriota TaxID=1817917 RepID=A0A1G2LFC8_9BACT|nr:MAG: hypothetical protein A3C12_01260 [Candidatus Sungbacteria bacterium RIFCSPHIGHO2_02_FULL_49_20]OHA10300.1 MAG: hypothetical protein A3H71_01795 [Candidatus Sungbacteria bacterium RIFCSPLOWO2_02_FULL_48_13b]